jgi:3-keto-5-aminohexanoate cleavage enzyme
MPQNLIINAALTGMVATQQQNPNLPITPAEIAADARRCMDAGASIVHLHARDEHGRPTFEKRIYREILQAVREACPEIILCVSTSGRIFRTFEERSEVLDLTDPPPEMASLTLGSMNFARQESVNSPEMINRLAAKMAERGILPEMECFELGMAEHAVRLIERGVLRPNGYCNILLGSEGTLGASAFNLSIMVNALPPQTIWAAGGIGKYQFDVNCLAVAMGGHVRVGLEDNLWLDRKRNILATNAGLVERIVNVARAMGREISSPGEARTILGLDSVAGHAAKRLEQARG